MAVSARAAIGRGLNLKEGTVRRARHEAGLSLAQVAGSDVSRTAIHLIETGKSRPTAVTLKLIAQRTGKPLDYFLADAEALPTSAPDWSGAVAALDAERFAEAASLAERALDLRVSPLDALQLHLCAGEAWLRLGQPDRAERHLTRALEESGQTGDSPLRVEALDWYAALCYVRQEARAIDIAREALWLCQSLTPIPTRLEVRILGRIGAIHTSRHQWDDALTAYEAAVEAARSVHDFSRTAKMYNDLSIIHRHLGRLDRADEYARKAITVHELLGDDLSVARARTNLALTLLQSGDAEASRRELALALQVFTEANVEMGRANILTALSENSLAAGQAESALDYALEALALAERLGEKMSAAEAHMHAGQALAKLGRSPEMDERFQTAISMFRSLALKQRLCACHATYAQVLETSGRVEDALVQWRLAVATVDPEAAGGAEEKLSAASSGDSSIEASA